MKKIVKNIIKHVKSFFSKKPKSLKRVAIGLFGISYKENYEHWVSQDYPKPYIFKIDFRNSIHNFFARLVNPITQKGYKVDFFGSTYRTKGFTTSFYKKYYPFKDLYLMSKAESEKYRDITELRNAHYLKVLDMILNSKQNYDFIVLTRWDLYFLQSFSDLNIDYKKINISHKVQVNEWADDNFYIIPGEYLKKYRNFIEKWNNAQYIEQEGWWEDPGNRWIKSHHKMVELLQNGIPIHYLEPGKIEVADSPIYNIVRGNVQQLLVGDQVDWWGLGDNKDFPRFVKKVAEHNRVKGEVETRTKQYVKLKSILSKLNQNFYY